MSQPYDPFGQQQGRGPQSPPGWQPQQPYQGQPWQGQQPYPGQPPAPGPRRPRRRGKIIGVTAGVAGVIIVAGIAAAAADGTGHTIATGTASSPSATRSASAKATARPAGIGSVITLSGNTSGEQVAVTVVRVLSHAQPAGEFDTPKSGDRLYAVQFRLSDTGSAAYSDAPDNGAVVTDAKGQSYQSSIDNAAECTSFPGTENIAPGQSGLGCVVFEVPRRAVITQVQFTLDSGMGPDTGQWSVRR